MKAVITLILNSNEIDRAIDLGYPPPEPEYFKSKMNFRLEKVDYFYLSHENEIIIIINGSEIACDYNNELYKSLIAYSNDQESRRK